ncbi:family 2 glycosyl transferase [Idiomarina seosinensis]|uniref:Family 2 glycosyl transferase n=2 Tax=Idiomarina seosinensis TaxID=281739 RepID=A0A432ZLI5_9GAMM|nr:family 2 glycosyl transferase [Idiomarina seosinensis]
MATYNGAKYIKEQLQSFAEQTRQPDELIITDDCSTDETEAIVREFAKKVPFGVKFYRNQKKLGYCGNFNESLLKTTGDIIFLSDQDDVWFPEKIEYVCKTASKKPGVLAIMNDAELTDGTLNSVGLTKLGQMKSLGLGHERFVMGCCCAIRRELLDLCLPIPQGVAGHDNWVVAFADGLKSKFVCGKVLQYYRRHGSNESQFIANRTVPVTKLDVLLNSFRKLRKGVVDSDIRNIEQLEILLQGIDRALKSSNKSYNNQLKDFSKSVEVRLNHQIRRLNAKQKPFFLRLFTASRILMNGGYKNSNGIKSYIRDIYG